MSEIGYNPRAGRYVYTDTKRFVPQAVINNLREQEERRLEVRLQAHTRLLASGKLHLAEWQLRMGESLRDSHLRTMTLAAGGKDRLTPQHYGAAGYQLRRQFEYLDGFARSLHAGNLTEKQAIARAAMYASSIRVTFGRSEQISRAAEGFAQAMRGLDAGANHCPDCIDHATEGWVSLEAIVTPGTDCSCRQRCRCWVRYRRVNLSRRLPAA